MATVTGAAWRRRPDGRRVGRPGHPTDHRQARRPSAPRPRPPPDLRTAASGAGAGSFGRWTMGQPSTACLQCAEDAQGVVSTPGPELSILSISIWCRSGTTLSPQAPTNNPGLSRRMRHPGQADQLPPRSGLDHERFPRALGVADVTPRGVDASITAASLSISRCSQLGRHHRASAFAR